MKRGRSKTKRAISPVIITVLLVLLTVVLASIVFVYSKSFFKDQIAKFNPDRGEEGPIEELCAKVNIGAGLNGETIIVNNQGNIPVHKVGVILDGVTLGEYQLDLLQGQTKVIDPAQTISDKSVELSIILLGNNRDAEDTATFLCPKENWLQLN